MRKLSTLVAPVIFVLCVSPALAQPLEEPMLDPSGACGDLRMAYLGVADWNLPSPPNLGDLIARCNKAPWTCRKTRKQLNIGVEAAESITPWGELVASCAPPTCRQARKESNVGADAAESIKRRFAAELICYDRE